MCGVVAATTAAADDSVATNDVQFADLGTVVVEGTALSRYRPETVNGATFTDVPPEKLPTVVDTLTEDFIREHNPTDLHDLMRFVPGIESGGKSLLIRQPGTFSIRGKGGTTPSLDGVMPIGSGAGLFMDPFLMERVEIVKGPIGSLNGGEGASQNASGGGGSINLYIKSAKLEKDETNLAANTSVGKHTFRQRGMVDVNEALLEGKAAFRVVTTADYYEPTYIHQGSQKGAKGRESFTVAPSFIFAPSEEVTFGLKTLFQYTDQPSYIGVPVYRGHPGDGYSRYESSCRPGDRSKYEGFMVNPWLDWQVTEDWLLKFGASLMVNSWEQTTREPYSGERGNVATAGARGAAQVYSDQLNYYYTHGYWPSGAYVPSFWGAGAGWGTAPANWPTPSKYSKTTGFGKSHQLNRQYNLYVRSIYDKDLYRDIIKNSFVVQPDYYYRESNGGFGTPTSRYGLTVQDAVTWGWFTVLGGARYDHFESEAYTSGNTRYMHTTADALSPRGGVSIQPLDWLVFFGNISQTRTPMLGLVNPDGSRPTAPWRSTQYEGGVRVSPVERLWLSLSTYRIEQENSPRIYDENYYTYDGANTSRGIELSLTGDITDNWTIMAMYSHIKYTDRTKEPGDAGRDFANYPEHTFSLSTSYRISSGPFEDIVIGGNYRYRSRSYGTMRGAYVSENLFYNPSHIFDINMSMPFSKFGGSKNWTLTLGIRNLFGEKYFESARHWYEALAGEPRTFEIGVRAKF